MKKMKKEERQKRIIARGEVSGHSHIVTGDCDVLTQNDQLVIKTKSGCAIKHLLETPYVNEGKEVWTEEHNDIFLKDNSEYVFVQQQEFNPYEKEIRRVKD